MERPRWRFTANYKIFDRLQIGAEINPKAKEIGPLFTLFLLKETDKIPALFVGTSSDRIGSPSGKQSYYLTGSKYFDLLRSSFYASVNYSEWDEEINFPYGANIEIWNEFSVTPMFDGDRSHLMLNYFADTYGVSLMYVWYEKLGVSISFGF